MKHVDTIISQISVSFSDSNSLKYIAIADRIKFIQALCTYAQLFPIIVIVHSTSCTVIVPTGDVCTHTIRTCTDR